MKEMKLLEAEKLAERSIDICKNFGVHPDLARSFSTLGLIKLELNQLQQAEECFKTSYDIRKKLFDPTHIKISNSLFEFGLLNKKKGNLSEALSLFNSCLSMRKTLLKDDSHPEVNIAIDNIENVKYLMNDKNTFVISVVAGMALIGVCFYLIKRKKE